MTRDEQERAFGEDLKRLVNRYAEEFDLTYGALVLHLEFMKFELMCKAFEKDEDEE